MPKKQVIAPDTLATPPGVWSPAIMTMGFSFFVGFGR